MRIFPNLFFFNILYITTILAILSKAEEDEAKKIEIEDEIVDLDSEPKGGFFDLLGTDDLPFQKRTFSIDFLNHKLEYALLEPINGECAPEIELFVFVPTRTDSFYTRMKIRESWAANLTDENIAMKFVVGWPSEGEDIYNLLLDEFTQFVDLIFYDIEDTYANLYLKVFVALQWQQFYCPNAKFVLKTDDDTCVDLSRLRWWIANEFVHRLNQYPASVFGGIWRGTKAIRSPSHRWYVPSSLYPKSKYPPYMNGPTYLMSSQAVSAILNVTKSVKAFTIEDILYTGILANIAHVKKFSVWQHFRQGKFSKNADRKEQPPVPPPKPKKELAKEKEEQPPKEEIVEKQEEMKEEKKEPEKPKKSLEDLYAAAREEFDLDLSPTESALKTLKEGREMQKLSVVRNLAELIEAEPAETMTKVIPAIQELLNVEPSNLDIHCEAAVVYKNCIKDQKLQSIWPDLPCQLLSAILENIERQKENVTAAAWLESLVDIADCVPQKSVISMIVPVAIAQSDSGKRVQRRVISTRLIEKLASLVPREIVQRDLSPCAQMLCQDPSTAVRTSIAQRLSILAQALNNSTDCCTLLLPCIIELCKDEDPAVREAILGSLDVCLPHFSKDAKKNILLPLLRKCSEQALILRDASLPVVSRHFGSWLQCLRDILTGADLRWWLDTYIRILDFAWQQSQDEKEGQAHNAKNIAAANNEQVMMLCRRMCAFNFPCIVSIFGEEKDVFTEKLMPVLEQFCRDPDEEVRAIVASGFHEILTFRKNNGPAATKAASTSKNADQQQPQLLNPFVELLSSGSGEVIQHLTGNLQKILPVLYKEISALGSKSNSILTKLNQMLISCNSLLRGSGSWRAHEAYLNSLAILRQLVRPKVIKQSFVPLLQQEILTARALPCRIAAAQSLLLMMRELPMAKDRQEIIEMFTKKIGQHSSCYRRRLLLDIVPPLLHNFSREFFIDKFLPSILKLSSDPISNIRLQLCRTLSIIKKYLVFPKDDKSLSSLEKVIRDLLASEQNAFSCQLIQQFACELSRAETDQKECKANKTKLIEEKRLWTEKEEVDETDGKLEAEKKTVTKKKQQPSAEKVTSSTESGIFVEEDGCTTPKPQKGLVRSATTANVPEAHLTGVFSSSKTISGMTIESPSSTATSSAASRRPPISTSFTPSWRTNRPVSATPKLAIVRPQPQAINQRSSSPMPPISAERKGSVEKGTTEMSGTNSARGNSKLPLSTARYRSPASKPNPGSQVQQLASKFMGNDGTEPVTDSLKLKKYKPREVLGQGNTTWSKSPQRMLQQSSTTPTPPPQSPAGRKSSAPSKTPASDGPVPLQTSASSSSLNGKSGGRRPYGLMKVQSTSSVLERKPAQIRCQVISMT